MDPGCVVLAPITGSWPEIAAASETGIGTCTFDAVDLDSSWNFCDHGGQP